MALESVSGATSTVAAETVYPVMVNGYMCYSAAEVAAVRRGQSPDSARPGNGSSSSSSASSASQDAAQAAADQQAQARALEDAQTRIAQFSQLQAQSPQDLEKLPRGSIVDIRA